MNAMKLPKTTNRSDLFILIILVVLIFIIAARTPLDSDLFWHLSAGRWMAENHKPLLTDPFSYTRENQGWVNHSWLSEVILFQLYRLGGWTALSIFVGVVATLSMVLAYLQMRGPAILRAFIVILACIPASMVWSPRPQVISLFFLALLTFILNKLYEQNQKVIWFLPLVFCLWGNLHGGYVLGIIFYITWVCGYWLDFFLENRKMPGWSHQEYYLVLFAGVLSVLTLVVNPNLVNILLISFKTVNVASLRDLVSEWSSPDFHVISQQSIIWLLSVVIISFAINKKKILSADILATIVFFYMALVSRRNFGPFSMVAIPIIGRSLWAGITKKNCGPDKNVSPELAPQVRSKEMNHIVSYLINLVIAGFLIMIAVIKPYIVSYPSIVEAYTHQLFPVAAIRNWVSIEETQPGRLLSEYDWGGYIMWADKKSPVFIDGRTDLYGDDIISEWVTLVQAGKDYQTLLVKYDIHAVLLLPDRPLVNKLIENGWIVRYQDSIAVLIVDPIK